MFKSKLFLLFFAFCLLLSFSSSVWGKKFAVVIGVPRVDCDKNENMDSCYYDAKTISDILESSGFSVVRCYEVIDKQSSVSKSRSGNEPILPKYNEINKQLDRLYEKAGKNDTVLVYFSGHGGIYAGGEDGRTWLILKDTDRSQLEKTALTPYQLRNDLNKCKAEHKLLILDTCYAGGTRGKNDSLPPNFKELKDDEDCNVITLASCGFQERSINSIVEDGTSWFTFLLSDALKGGADDDLDGQISILEVNNYIYNRQKTWNKSSYWEERVEQNCEIIGKEDLITSDNVFFLASNKIKSRELSTILDDMAYSIAGFASLTNKDILKFTSFDIKSQEEISEAKRQDDFRSITSNFTDILGDCLKAKNNIIKAELADDSKKSDDNKNAVSLKNEAIYIERKGENEKQYDVYVLKSTLALSDSENSDEQLSVTRKVEIEWADNQDDPEPDPEPDTAPMGLKKPDGIDFYLVVKDVNGVSKKREIEEVNDAWYVPIEKDETYRIYYQAKNASGENPIGVRILVDGKNTLPQRLPYYAFRGKKPITAPKMSIVGPAEQPASNEGDNDSNNSDSSEDENDSDSTESAETSESTENENGLDSTESAETPESTEDENSSDSTESSESFDSSENESNSSDVIFMPAVDIDNARFWILRTGDQKVVRGFYDKNNNCSDFVVKGIEDRDQYFSGIENDDPANYGLITIAFYEIYQSRGHSESMTVPGPKNRCPIITENGWEIGEKLYECRIRYASREAINAFQQNPSDVVPQESDDKVVFRSKKQNSSSKSNELKDDAPLRRPHDGGGILR